MLGSGWPAVALVGTKGLPWAALGNVRKLYLCLDLDETGEGQRAAQVLARQAVLRGVGVHTMDVGATVATPSLPPSGKRRVFDCSSSTPWFILSSGEFCGCMIFS